MISPALLAMVRCPRCRGLPVLSTNGDGLCCSGCGARFGRAGGVLTVPERLDLAGRDTDYRLPELTAALAGREIGHPWLGAAVRQHWLQRWLFSEPVGPVLDLGCGDGRFAYWNRQRAHIVGLDATPHFAPQARAAVDLVLGDGRALPFDDGAFRAAYSIDVLEHLDEVGIAAILAEVRRVLQPGSRFFVFTNTREPSTFQPLIEVQRRLSQNLRRRQIGAFAVDDLRKGDHVKALHTFEEVVLVAARHGFILRQVRFWNGLAQGWVDNVILRVAEHLLLDRRPASAGPAMHDQDTAAGAARQRAARRPTVAIALTLLTMAMQSDVALWGRFRSGPFFALLERQ